MCCSLGQANCPPDPVQTDVDWATFHPTSQRRAEWATLVNLMRLAYTLVRRCEVRPSGLRKPGADNLAFFNA